jgi:hypothetical protein
LRRLGHKIIRLCDAVAQKRRAHRLASRRQYAYAPLDIALYVRFLREVRVLPKLALVPFAAAPSRTGGPAQMFVRHDVDTALCVEMLPLVLDVDRQERVPAAVFVRADRAEYRPEEAAAVLRAHGDGVEIGLHSSCYLEDDFLAAFSEETERFKSSFGFAPRSFTVHGLGEYRFAVRERFVASVSTRLDEFGYEFSDCDTRLRSYDHVFQDCHLEVGTGRRFILSDLEAPRAFIREGRDYLLLTHPCYWRQ